MYLSIISPVRNEEKNIKELHERLLKVCKSITKDFEIIYIENASTDNSKTILKNLKKAKLIFLRWEVYMRNAQSLAMDAGFKAAKGKFVVYIDSDLQVDPEEIPAFVKKLEEGYDVVSGWRQKRKETIGFDLFVPIKLILRGFYGLFRRRLIDEGVHDPGSALKAFRREALQDIDLYGEMHRFLIALLHWQGYKICEIKIAHHPRKYGKSNYTITKGFQGFADLINIFIWRKYADRPLHLFGVGGLFIFTFGMISLISLLVMRVFEMIALKDSILPVLSVLVIILGFQLFINGIIADSLSRIQFYDSGKRPYLIKEVVEV